MSCELILCLNTNLIDNLWIHFRSLLFVVFGQMLGDPVTVKVVSGYSRSVPISGCNQFPFIEFDRCRSKYNIHLSILHVYSTG